MQPWGYINLAFFERSGDVLRHVTEGGDHERSTQLVLVETYRQRRRSLTGPLSNQSPVDTLPLNYLYTRRWLPISLRLRLM